MLDLSVAEEAKAYETIKSYILKGPSGCTWGAVVRKEDGSVETVRRRDRPCWGELRRYEDGTRPDDPHPGDIPSVIPKGQREALAVPVWDSGLETKDHNAVFEFLFSPEGPWRRGWKGTEFHYNDGYLTMVSTVETDVDPTVMVSALLTMKGYSYAGIRNLKGFAEVPPEERADFFFLKGLLTATYPFRYRDGTETKTLHGFQISNNAYFLSPQIELKRFREGDALDLSNGRTWQDQEDYNRPEIHTVFGGDVGAPFEYNRLLEERGIEASPHVPYYKAYPEEERSKIEQALKEILL